MPMIDGKLVRARYTSLKLGEISSVDNPAQPGARASVIKRHDAPPAPPSLLAVAVAKWVGSDDGAHTFEEVLRENKFSDAIWPLTDALSQSIRSIVGDTSVSSADRETKITSSVDQFLAAVRDIDPTVEKRFAAVISKRNPNMATIEELTRKVEELTGQLTAANASTATEKARADKAEGELTTEKAAHGETQKALTAATDEVITVGGTELRKSVAGEANFSVAKALAGERDMARTEKRVETEFRHVAGSTAEKALVLTAAERFDEPTRKAFDAILKSAETMAAGAFKQFGNRGDPTDPTTDVAKAQATFDGKVSEIAKRDNIPTFEAMRKARTEFPAEFEAANAA